MLPWNGTTLLSHMIGVLSTVTEQVIVVTDVAEKYDMEGAQKVVGDEYPGAGPLGGILTGLNQVDSGYHYVAACDLPLLNPEVLRLLMKLAGGHEACVPSINGNLEPLCGVYHRACRPTFRQVISRGEDLSVHMALKLLALQEVQEDQLREIDPDLKSFTNLNTLDDYGRANPSR